MRIIQYGPMVLPNTNVKKTNIMATLSISNEAFGLKNLVIQIADLVDADILAEDLRVKNDIILRGAEGGFVYISSEAFRKSLIIVTP